MIIIIGNWKILKYQIKLFYMSFQSNDFWSIYGPWTLKFGQIFSCQPLFFAMIWDIDLIFGMRVYNHRLFINFEICSGWMIFGQLTAVGLWNLAKYLVVTTLRKNFNDYYKVMFYRYRTSYSYASVVDSWSYQDLLRQYCFLQ